MKLPRLYPILDVASVRARGLHVSEVARGLVGGGAEILQLRDKQSSPQQVLQHAREISQAVAGSSCMPVMNDRADLALLAGWHAVHVGHRDLPPDAVRRVFGADPPQPVLVGVSTHTDEQVRAADGSSADYIAVGPVFRTGTKLDAEPVIGLDGVRRARSLTEKPIVAIGGLTPETAASVIEAGADAVAVIGALFSCNDGVEQTVRDFLRRLR